MANDKKKILIVEDDQAINEMCRELLSDQYTLLIFSSGEAALASIEKGMAGTIDLIITDYKLPDMTGIEVVSALKKNIPSVPILFITGYGNETLAVNAFRSGVKDYLKKPFSFDELLKRVNFLSSIQSMAKVKESRSMFKEHTESRS